tara:strand:+ start:1537 stop:2118 length:582 start_codon:yes stop_codon:yes gene_type:complete
MKKIIKLTLFSLVILFSILFYKIYFTDKDKSNLKINTTLEPEENNKNNENNLIKNLKYEVKLDQQNQYIITSDLSEITYENGIEIVKMNKAVAVFIDQNNVPLTVTSDLAKFNNSTYNTNFSQNVRIVYLNNEIFSDKLDLNFVSNLIKIYQNVEYIGVQGQIFTDNIEIDLNTKKIKIYMENVNDNVKVISK